MSNYRRLISYIYAYEGGVKGKNIGFAKIETRGIQCKITVSVKRIYMGGNDIGVYLLAGDQEIYLGNIFIRGGSGEYRTVVSVNDIEHSGVSVDQCFGLTIHDVKNTWRSYTTIWEDAVAHAAEVDLGNTASGFREKDHDPVSEEQIKNAVREIEEEFPLKSNEPQEAVQAAVPVEGEKVEASSEAQAADEDNLVQTESEQSEAENPQTQSMEKEAEESGSIDLEFSETGSKEPEAEEFNNEGPDKAGMEQKNVTKTESARHHGIKLPEPEPELKRDMKPSEPESELRRDMKPSEPEPELRRDMKPSEPEPELRRDMKSAESDPECQQESGSTVSEQNNNGQEAVFNRKVQIHGNEQLNTQAAGIRENGNTLSEPYAPYNHQGIMGNKKQDHPTLGNPEKLEHLRQSEDQEEITHNLVWEKFKHEHTRILAFDYENGCEILTIKPQDIGLLPKESWVFGSNSFLLHGYYNYRYLILAKLLNPVGTPRYLLGIPGHYYSNERYMASMFGFPNFVLSKEQPKEDGRFGYWYTDIKLGG